MCSGNVGFKLLQPRLAVTHAMHITTPCSLAYTRVHSPLALQHTVFCASLFHPLHFHYVFMPDIAQYIEFMTHKWGTWAHVPELLSVDTQPVLFPMSKPLGEQGRKVMCMKRARLLLESKWEVPSDPGKGREGKEV